MDLTPDQEIVCDAVRDYQKVAVQASHSVGKCVAASDYLTVDGERHVRAEELVDTVFTMTTVTDNGALLRTLARAEWNTSKPELIYRLSTVAGQRIRRNARHPVWAGIWDQRKLVVRPVGWVAMADITKDHYVASPCWLPRGTRQEPHEFLYLAGALYADGRVGVSVPTYSVPKDPEHEQRLKDYALAQGALLCRREMSDGKHEAPRLMSRYGKGDSRFAPFMAWLRANGAPHGERYLNEYGVPTCVWTLDNPHLAVFLEAALRQGGDHLDARPIIRSTSARFLREVQELFLHFALETHITNGVLAVTDCRSIRDALDRFRGGYIAPKLEQWLLWHAPPHMRWVKVASCSQDGSERTVAIEVPGSGTFVSTLYEHNTYLLGGLTLWRYVCFPDSKIITTAPGEDSVKDLLWGVVRKLWGGRPGLMPSAPELHDPDRPRMSHYAVGRVAAKGEGFQGRHDEFLMVIMDEAVGIDRIFFIAANAMITDPANRWVIIFNPTDISSAAYQACLDPEWHVVKISAVNHPNVLADMAGTPRPFPGAVSYDWLDKLIRKDSTPIRLQDVNEERDIEWPPGSGEWWTPGFETETRGLGRWPSVSTAALWSEQMWGACMQALPLPAFDPVIIGCDVASTGENDTCIVVRRGPCALYAESGNNWDSTRTADRLRELADEYGGMNHQDGKTVQVNIDETGGYGRGVIDQSYGYNFVGVHSSSKPMDDHNFPNRRSELWFTTANLCKLALLDFTRLPYDFRSRLRADLMAVRWEVNPTNQQRVIEPKKKTIARLGRSPDSADAVNLAFSGGAVVLPMLPVMALSGGWSRRR